MKPAIDPFHPVLRVLERYRSDVHHLRAPAPDGTTDAVQAHLGQELPGSLRGFLSRWNGATLFRGALRIRGAADLAPPNAGNPDVILFADGPREEDRWAFAATEFGHHFGRWDGARLMPLHDHFNRWLLAQTRLLDENVRDDVAELAVRLEVDPQCGLLWFLQGEAMLQLGDADGATAAFRRATALAPDHPGAWQRLGEALLASDEGQARGALLMAWRAVRFPLHYPGAPTPGAELVHLLEARFPAGDAGWQRELQDLLAERVPNIRHRDADLVVAAAMGLVRARLASGDRTGARDALVALRDRATGWAAPPDLTPLHFALVALHTDLGDHDDAEEVLRRLRRSPDPVVLARAELALAKIALYREEPWVSDIVQGALATLKTAADRCEGFLLLAEAHRGRDAASVEQATRLAGTVGDPVLMARAALVRGDLARAQGDMAAAHHAWLHCADDPETALRAEVRIGDSIDEPADALVHYARAIDGYKKLQLPIREAWARLRLVRCGDASQALEAVRVFKAAGLAAGVATSDTLSGRPGHSLEWHLNLSAEAARERYDAQRMRPPWTRADADRPERRLLAHGNAIANADERIVQVLAAEVETELRRLQASNGRARDPAAMRFVAGIDLLAGHPSWAAAKIMMALLVEDVRQPVAERGLVGALARSPNMTLVDALVRALSEETEPTRLALIAETLGWRREAAATPRLRELATSGSLPLRRAAITALGRIGDVDAIDLIFPGLEVPELAETASTALLLLGEWQGVDFFAQALARNERWLTHSPGEIVGRHGGPAYFLLLMRTCGTEGAGGIGSLAGLGLMGNIRAVPRLVESVGSRDPQRQVVASTALEVITGHHEDVEDAHPKQRWLDWWAEHGPDFEERVRYRDGRPLTVRSLIERLGHDDFAARQSAYDELVIATGARLPFDADGPWRAQLAHRAAWEAWWADNAHDLPATGWLFHGSGT
ncbi:MAG: tetratricopeptide repeat protein [Myxococcales bacterium]|nr:tetratricopeptide repeat protein [Myxococcales bacterium]